MHNDSDDRDGPLRPEEVERWFRRLLDYLSRPQPDVAQLVAIAHFTLGLPRDGYFCGAYLEDLAPGFKAVLASPSLRSIDPEIANLAERARRVFVSAGIPMPSPLVGAIDGAAGSELGTVAASEDEAAKAAPAQNRSSTSTKASVRFPVVHHIPSRFAYVPGAASMAEVDVEPALRGLGERRNEWNAAGEHLHRASGVAVGGADAALLASHPSGRARESAEAPGRSRKRQRLGFNLRLTSDHTGIQGESLELGLGVAMMGALVARRHGGRGFKPSSRLAWTGCLDERTGSVTEVLAASLRLKVRSAFHGELDGIVVPASQAHIAGHAADEAQRECDARHAKGALGLVRTRPFAVHGATTLEDVARHREWLEPWRIELGRRRYSLRAMGLLVIFLATAVGLGAALLYLHQINAAGPRVEFSPPPRHGVTVYLGGIAPPITQASSAAIQAATLATDLDASASKGTRLILDVGFREGHTGAVEVYRVPPRWLWFFPNRLDWEWQFTSSGLPIEPLLEQPGSVYNPRELCVGNMDADPGDELIVGTTLHPHSTVILHLFDDQRHPFGEVLIKGHLTNHESAIGDLDHDGVPELVVLGLHQATHGASLLILRKSDFYPWSDPAAAGAPSDGATNWDAERQVCAAHLVFPLMTGLEEVGVVELFSNGLQVLPSATGEDVLQFSIQLPTPHDGMIPGYFVNVTMSGELVDAYPTDTLKTANARWRLEGVTSIDFTSDEAMREWTRSFRIANRILLGDPSGERPLHQKASR